MNLIGFFFDTFSPKTDSKINHKNTHVVVILFSIRRVWIEKQIKNVFKKKIPIWSRKRRKPLKWITETVVAKTFRLFPRIYQSEIRFIIFAYFFSIPVGSVHYLYGSARSVVSVWTRNTRNNTRTRYRW